MESIPIHSPYITLGQLLKWANVAHSGGEIKHRLAEGTFLVDGVVETRRGRKVYPGMTVTLDDGRVLKVLDETQKPSP